LGFYIIIIFYKAIVCLEIGRNGEIGLNVTVHTDCKITPLLGAEAIIIEEEFL